MKATATTVSSIAICIVISSLDTLHSHRARTLVRASSLFFSLPHILVLHGTTRLLQIAYRILTVHLPLL